MTAVTDSSWIAHVTKRGSRYFFWTGGGGAIHIVHNCISSLRLRPCHWGDTDFLFPLSVTLAHCQVYVKKCVLPHSPLNEQRPKVTTTSQMFIVGWVCVRHLHMLCVLTFTTQQHVVGTTSRLRYKHRQQQQQRRQQRQQQRRQLSAPGTRARGEISCKYCVIASAWQ